MLSFRLDDKVVVVVGAASGIGRAVASVAAQQGANVPIVDVKVAGATETAAAVQALGRSSKVYAADVADARQVASAFDGIVRDFGRIDAVIHVAGIFEVVPYLQIGDAGMKRMLDVNFNGVHNTMRHVLPLMIEQRHGKIVAIASVAGKIGGGPGAAHYGASKGAVIAFVKSLAREFGRHNINVNAITPGIIDTDMAVTTGQRGVEAMLRYTAAKRVGQPEEVAAVAVFLCTDAARYVTGQAWNVCGGYLMD